MSENIIQECETRLNSLQRGIETATGESYNDLTEAVKGAIDKVEIYKFLMYEQRALKFDLNESALETPLLDCINITNLSYAFSRTGFTKVRLKNTHNVTNFGMLCLNSYNLIEIETLDLSSATTVSSIFQACKALVEIRFVPNTIKVTISFQDNPLLSEESLQSIIDGLAIVEDAKILRLHANAKAMLTEEQLTTITNKNWSVS